MIVREEIEIGKKKKKYIKTYSDANFYIQRDEEMYTEAIDPIAYAEERVYVETDIPIEPETIE